MFHLSQSRCALILRCHVHRATQRTFQRKRQRAQIERLRNDLGDGAAQTLACRQAHRTGGEDQWQLRRSGMQRVDRVFGIAGTIALEQHAIEAHRVGRCHRDGCRQLQ